MEINLLMKEKDTQELNSILGKTHPSDFEKYSSAHKEDLSDGAYIFCEYIKELLREKKLTQQVVFLRADIPERYGYKILSGEKHTRQRDIILRICYASELTLDETQRALRKYELPTLYAKIPRDALLITIFNTRPGSIIDVNELLKANNMEPLRTSGIQD